MNDSATGPAAEISTGKEAAPGYKYCVSFYWFGP